MHAWSLCRKNVGDLGLVVALEFRAGKVIYSTVELFLNSVWFALVAGGLCALLRANRRDLHERRFLLGLGALLCASALLFPTISITDDLHIDAFVVEDSNATKRFVKAIAHTIPISEAVSFGFIAFAFLLALRQRTWRVVETISPGHNIPLLMRPLLGRAPPMILAA